MIWILIIISIGLFILGNYILSNTDLELTATGLILGSIITFLGGLIFLITCIDGIVSGRVIDKKIYLYKNQNKNIEKKIELVVKEYKNFEKDTFTELKSESYITLVNLYPELKSDKMVQQQINLYTKNNKKITELKEEKINITIYKWWVYFGK